MIFINSQLTGNTNFEKKMKKDISNRDDVMVLVNSFYNHVKRDKLLAPFFNDIAKVNWNSHLPKMYDFWENVIFHTGSYHGNTLKVHLNLNELMPLSEDHFEHWLLLFKITAKELFEGPNTQMAINKAESIATLIKIKLIQQK